MNLFGVRAFTAILKKLSVNRTSGDKDTYIGIWSKVQKLYMDGHDSLAT